MDKNENGYPNGGTVGGVVDNNSSGGGCGSGCSGGCGSGNGGGSVGGAHNHTCGGRGDCLDDKPLAYVYSPDQSFRLLYSANDSLKHGTLFEELYKPMEVYGRE